MNTSQRVYEILRINKIILTILCSIHDYVCKLMETEVESRNIKI